MTDAAADSFWKFSLAFHAERGLEQAFLVLQDQEKRDVNIALYACWIGISGRGRLQAADFAAAEAAIAPWRRQVTEPLRQVRRAMKPMTIPGAQPLREKVKDIELESEKIVQSLLVALAPAPQPGDLAARLNAAIANIEAYAGNGETVRTLVLALRSFAPKSP